MDPIEEFTGINHNAVERLSRAEQRKGHIGFTNVNNVKEFGVTNLATNVRNAGVTKRNSTVYNKNKPKFQRGSPYERRTAMNNLERMTATQRKRNNLKTWTGSSWNSISNMMAKSGPGGHLPVRPAIWKIAPVRRNIIGRTIPEVEGEPYIVANVIKNGVTNKNATSAHEMAVAHHETMKSKGNKKSANVVPWRGGRQSKRRTRRLK
jgi:hypothetical protein